MSVRRTINAPLAEGVNPFLTQPIGRVFLSNAVPMAVVMSTGGLLNVVDGIFVGRFVGADALAAISLAFPVVMVLTALTTLVGGGMRPCAHSNISAARSCDDGVDTTAGAASRRKCILSHC